MVDIIQLHPDLPSCFVVVNDGEDLGEIEQLADGTWIGDITKGNGPPSKPYATRDEAVTYVVNFGDPRCPRCDALTEAWACPSCGVDLSDLA